MNSQALVFYAIFAVLQVVVYLSIRRRLLPPLLTAALGMLLSIVIMTLMGLAQGNTVYQALFAGFLVGGLFCGGVLAMAWYFQTGELRRLREREAALDDRSGGSAELVTAEDEQHSSDVSAVTPRA